MELKKNSKANLEKAKGVFFLIGIVVALGIVVLLFEWSTADTKAEVFEQLDENIDDEKIAITRMEEKKPKPPPQEKQVSDIIEIVDDKTVIENEFDFDMDPDDDAVDFIDMDVDDDDGDGGGDEVFFVVEKMPKFPGGDDALRQYIAENVDYPVLAQENDIQGTVYVRFVVLKTGAVGEVQVVRGVDKLLDDEAIRVVESLPKFEPGSQRGKKVNVWYTVPIKFQLNTN